MPCYHPLPAWYSNEKNPSTGKRPLVFKPESGPHEKRHAEVPCGTCIGCKLERSRDWATRCMHEAQLHDHNHFITLTYDQEHLPPGGTLRPKDLTDFFKRLRFHNGPFRYFACGEYGSQLLRPHYHVIAFGLTISDLSWYNRDLCTSSHIDTVWGHGIAMIGNVTFDSAAYVARYALKKVTGPAAETHYQGKHPEFLRMSRRPGLGREWLDKYATDTYPSDTVITRGHPSKPPRYYDNLIEKRNVRTYKTIKHRRRKAAAESPDNTGRRLIVRENVKTAATQLLSRSYER